MKAITPLTVDGVAMRGQGRAEQVEAAGPLEHADQHAHAAHHHDHRPRAPARAWPRRRPRAPSRAARAAANAASPRLTFRNTTADDPDGPDDQRGPVRGWPAAPSGPRPPGVARAEQRVARRTAPRRRPPPARAPRSSRPTPAIRARRARPCPCRAATITPTALNGDRLPAFAPLPSMSAVSSGGSPAVRAGRHADRRQQRDRRDGSRAHRAEQARQGEEEERQRSTARVPHARSARWVSASIVPLACMTPNRSVTPSSVTKSDDGEGRHHGVGLPARPEDRHQPRERDRKHAHVEARAEAGGHHQQEGRDREDGRVHRVHAGQEVLLYLAERRARQRLHAHEPPRHLERRDLACAATPRRRRDRQCRRRPGRPPALHRAPDRSRRPPPPRARRAAWSAPPRSPAGRC